MKNIWTSLLAIILPLLGYILFNKKTDNSKDAVLKYQQEEKEKALEEQKKSLNTLKEDHEKDIKNNKELDTAGAEEFWKNRGNS